MEAAEGLSREVGVAPACRALSVARATFYRRRRATSKPSVPAVRPTPARALSPQERQMVLDLLHSPRFVDKAPAEAFAILLDEGIYLCSERTMYRVLADHGEVRERRNIRRHVNYKKPELLATAPNQVWSWDITKLKGPAKWIYFYLYVILDIFSRYSVGWMTAHREAESLAKRLIEETCEKQGILPGQLTMHADRGPSMRSKTVGDLLIDLGVTKTHSRPYTSTDNPYSEAQFKTLKYRPEFPTRFGSIEDARDFCQVFFNWYNTEHRHSGIGYLTPEIVHYGYAEKIIEARQNVLNNAFELHPERFVKKAPEPPPLPDAVWINKPKQMEITNPQMTLEVVKHRAVSQKKKEVIRL
jgi:putative transposase